MTSKVQVTQEFIETAVSKDTKTRVTQEFTEVAVSRATKVRVTQEFLEIAVLANPPFLDAVLAGQGSLQATLNVDQLISADLLGSGYILGELVGDLVAHLVGQGTLEGTLGQTFTMEAFLEALGSLSPDLIVFSDTILATLIGKGIFLPSQLDGDFTLNLQAIGKGVLTPTTRASFAIQSTIVGIGSLRGRIRKASDVFPGVPPGDPNNPGSPDPNIPPGQPGGEGGEGYPQGVWTILG